MSPTATLRFAPWRAKTQLAPPQYAALAAAVARVLAHTLALPDAALDAAWARAFVCAYAHDAARHALHGLDAAAAPHAASADERAIRTLTLRLAGRLAAAHDGGGLPASALVDLATAHGAHDTAAVQRLFRAALASAPDALRLEFAADVLPALAAAARAPERRAAHVLAQLLHCSPAVALLAAADPQFAAALARGYEVPPWRDGGAAPAAAEAEPGRHTDWLRTKTSLLDAFHALVQALLQRAPPARARDELAGVLFALLALPGAAAAAPATPFVAQPLLADYEYAFGLSSTLREKFGGAEDDARVDVLVAALRDMAPPGPRPAGALAVLLTDRARAAPGDGAGPSMPPLADAKGKRRAVEQQDPDRERALERAVAQVADIFPAEAPQHIRRCLAHAAFAGDAERLVAALLEGTLPAELGAADAGAAAENAPRTAEEFAFTRDRRNVWDGAAMDYSRLRIGKRRDDADGLLQDRSFAAQMKADIIRRVQELSDDDDDEEEEQAAAADAPRPLRHRTVAFEDELDDGAFADRGVNVAGDGDASSDGGADGDAAAVSPETVLELAYVDDPALFDRDAATRRSQARLALKARTGWGDEQIEGWRIMLERNPKKDKILRKHEFAGNALLLVPDTNTTAPAPEPGPSGSSRPSHRGRGGRGHGGGGRGGGGGGGETSARDRAWKDKNKARQGNHGRKRGHDKKMARGGGGGAPPA